MRATRRLLTLSATIGAWLIVPGCSMSSNPPATPEFVESTGVRLARVAHGLSNPVYLTAPAGDARSFIVEQPGRIRILAGDSLLTEPFLDITDRVRDGGERGLLSVAFHPRYRDNGFLYVNYTDAEGDTRVERYHVSADPNRAAASSAVLILHVDQPYANHNGGLVLFGPDSMLYVGMGDGGAGGDPQNNAQDRTTLLGALLRLDVDHGTPYAIPRDNPFVGQSSYRGEIWAWGLRNPWRFAFDVPSGLLYIADVGQNKWEEVNVVSASRGGLNFGWRLREGLHDYDTSRPTRYTLTPPVYEYDHSQGCSITGGVVYRGRALPELVGHYLFADYCGGWVRSFLWDGRAITHPRQWTLDPVLRYVTSFGVDGSGEVYVMTIDGDVYRLMPGE